MSNILDISKLNPGMVNLLFDEGAIFLFLDVPIGTEFGIDMKAWNTDENFKGIKMIPPGIHYIHYSCVDNCGEIGPRSGFFHNFQKQEFVIKKWDKKTENICTSQVTEDELKRYKNNIRGLDKYLGCYPYDIYPKWIKLSDHVHDNLINKLTPSCGIIRAAVDLVACKDADRPRGKCQSNGESSKSPRSGYRRSCKPHPADEKEDLLPELKPVEGTDVRFTKFPERHYPDGATPSQITEHSLDYSYLLQCMINCHDKPIDFLGEIQFAYICFLIGGNLDAFEQWKELIGLLCNCQKAITKHRSLYDNLIDVLEIQLSEIPEEFLADIVSNNNFIYIKLRSLLRFVSESAVDGILKTKMDRFKQRLTEKYNWDLSNVDDESDDEAPVVVDINCEMYNGQSDNKDIEIRLAET